MTEKTKRMLVDLGVEVLGSSLIAVALYQFAVAAQFPMTGFSGLALIGYRLFGFPIGLSTLVLNLPVALLCYRMIGRGFLLRSLRCMAISAVFVDYIAPLFPVYTGSRMLAAIACGVLGGIGYAMIYSRNSSTGGSDFLIMAMKAKKPHLKLGTIAFWSDVGIILLGGVLFRDVDGILYAMIINYLFAAMVDRMMLGLNAGKVAFVVTAHGRAVADAVEKACNRGSTILKAQGGYQGEEKELVMVACRTRDMFLVERAVKEAAEDAFLVILDSGETHGNGFSVTKVAEQER